MLNWAATFLIIALVAGALGMFGVAGTSMEIARVLFVIFLVMFLVSLVTGRASGQWGFLGGRKKGKLQEPQPHHKPESRHPVHH